MVTLKNANHFGIAGYYGLMATREKLIGLAFTNTSPWVVPTRGAERVIGTNPISFFASEDTFHLDMATSTVAAGKIEMKRRLGESMPESWAVDSSGNSTTDPEQFMGLTGVGGSEATGGYKGFGLGAMVGILCGPLAGGSFGKQIRQWRSVLENENPKTANLGQCFIAVNPAMFSDTYEKDLQEFAEMLRESKPMDGTNGPILPGDRAAKHEKMSENSINYRREVIDQIHAGLPDITPMKTI